MNLNIRLVGVSDWRESNACESVDGLPSSTTRSWLGTRHNICIYRACWLSTRVVVANGPTRQEQCQEQPEEQAVQLVGNGKTKGESRAI